MNFAMIILHIIPYIYMMIYSIFQNISGKGSFLDGCQNLSDEVMGMKNVMQCFILYIKLLLCIYAYIKYKTDQLYFPEVVYQWISPLLSPCYVQASMVSAMIILSIELPNLLFFDHWLLCLRLHVASLDFVRHYYFSMLCEPSGTPLHQRLQNYVA